MTPNLPNHVAIIMDGNGRWAAERDLPRTEGHRAGARSLRCCIENCGQIGIPYLSVFAFSTENWKRSSEEVRALMMLMAEFSRSELHELKEQGVKVVPLGAIEELAAPARSGIETLARETADCEGLTLLLGVNYGGRADIAQAARELSRRVLAGEIDPQDIDESTVARQLYSHPYPDPDLIIRTGGEWRLSNFYLFQAAYSELYSCETYWPDFGADDLREALCFYAGRQRRFGSLPTDRGGTNEC
ncbi:MAG: polyprenyl diphosphate synthase [Bacillota bacterium]